MLVKMKDNFKAGHRKRLRKRFLKGGLDAVADYELLELLLFGSNPRQDMKPLAQRLIQHFGNLSQVIHALPLDLEKIEGVGESAICAIKVVQVLHHRLLQIGIENKPIMSSWQQVIDYCYATMGHLQNEQLKILFLDSKNQILKDEVQQIGTVNHTPIYTREVLKRALELGASGIVLVHNHPSGDPTPSNSDIIATQEIDCAARTMGIRLHDHIIIGHNRYVSLRSEGILQ